MQVLAKRTMAITFVTLLALVWLFGRGNAGRSLAFGFLKPFSSAWTAVQRRFSRPASTLVPGSLPSSPRKVRELEARLHLLELKLARVDGIVEENRQLREVATLPRRREWRMVIADVAVRDPVTWNRGFLINRGSRHGIVPGAAVLTHSAVIGKIYACSASNAVVRLVGADGCELSVTPEGTAANGILRGTKERRWRHPAPSIIDFLPKSLEMTRGQRILTSGLGGTIPEGLLVGRVAGKSGMADTKLIDGAYLQVRVEPATDLSRIRVVVVACPMGYPSQPGSLHAGTPHERPSESR
ncbi:MAG: rod shape-determining protein MreC [Lentisphaeria bacterium]|nr:rod shape-determining protein MreC [Lentisphaeria bacterium]